MGQQISYESRRRRLPSISERLEAQWAVQEQQMQAIELEYEKKRVETVRWLELRLSESMGEHFVVDDMGVSDGRVTRRGLARSAHRSRRFVVGE